MTDRKPRREKLRVPEPSRLGPYALVSELDVGLLGARWLGFIAEGQDRGRLIAARRIQTGTNVTATTKLEQAARIAMGIRHAKVTAVLDVVKGPGEVTVVSEHMDGEPLSSLLSLAVLGNTPIPPAVALAITRDVVAALMAVHAAWRREAQHKDSLLRRSAHGGLQPDAVLVATFGEALLTEPGVAGAAAALPRFAKQPVALPYRAPEQVDPAASANERTDVFCAGVMLWELLAGTPLFGPKDRLRRPTITGNVHELQRELLEKPIPSLDTIQRPGAPIYAEVAVLVARALQRAPNNRYADLAELKRAIDELPAGRVATEEQVAATVDRLARSRIEARRASFEQAVGGRVMDSAPPSSMATDKPAPPSRPLTVVIPGDEWRGDSLAELASFSITEVPTKSGVTSAAGGPESVPPPEEDRATALPIDAAPRAQPAAPPAIQNPTPQDGAADAPLTPAPSPDKPLFPVDPAVPTEPFGRSPSEMSDAGIALPASLAETAGEPRRKGRALVLAGLGAALLAALVVAIASSMRTATEDSPEEPVVPAADTTDTPAPSDVSGEPPGMVHPPDESPPNSDEATAETSDETAGEMGDESADEQPVRPTTTRPRPGSSVEKRDRTHDQPVAPRQPDGKAFRPSGI